MSAAWATVLALAAATAVIRASGPVVLGGREIPARATAVIGLFAPALLAALVVVGAVGAGEGGAIELDARLGGVAAAAGVLAVRRHAMIPAVIVAAAATALLRALG